MKPLDSLSDDEFSRLTQRALRELPEVPPALTQHAVALFEPAPGLAAVASAAGALAVGAVRHLLASLSADSWGPSGQALGQRSLRDPTRHLLYSAQGRDIDLRVVPEADAFALAGQILGPDEAGVIELRRVGSASPQRAELDDLGGFRIAGLSRGAYFLTLHLGADLIELPPLQLGDAGAQPPSVGDPGA